MKLNSQEYMNGYKYYRAFTLGLASVKGDMNQELLGEKEIDTDAESMAIKSEVAYYRGDVSKAKRLSEKSIKLAIANNQWDTVMMAASMLGKCAVFMGDIIIWEKAFSSIEEACGRDATLVQSGQWMRNILYTAVEMLDMIDDCICDETNDSIMEIENLNIVRFMRVGCYFGKGDLEKVSEICMAAREEFRGTGAPVFMYNSMALASVYTFSEDNDKVLWVLKEALDEAKKTGLIMPIAEMGSPVITYLSNKNFPDYADTLNKIRALNREYLSGLLKIHGYICENDLLSELTPKEFAVVKCAADGLHNSEIAEKMSISQNTVKSYLKIAFEKLGVRKRKDLGAALDNLKDATK
ncbi:MAG: helix-turn-helix transcriptional regulator [Clostridiales bacterium]|nr:helix-turn-helix transcriptional regulator [Clostridiales bacterium]